MGESSMKIARFGESANALRLSAGMVMMVGELSVQEFISAANISESGHHFSISNFQSTL
jgi:hypothetical protein